MYGLKGILAPFPVDTFLAQHLNKEALYQPGPSDKFEGLFGWEDINHLLNTTNPQHSIKLVHNKNVLDRSQLANLSYWLDEGATLVIDWLQNLDEFLYRFSQQLALDFNTIVNINCYVSCPNKQGFDMHFDRHDVFIIQAEGSKRWRIFQPTQVKTPSQKIDYIFDQCDPPDPETDKPYCDCVTRTGDVLYIPRGHWHYAVAESPSVHLTLGIDPTTGSDLLNWMTNDLMRNDEFFRQDIPITYAPELAGTGGLQPISDYVQVFKTKLREALDHTDLVETIIHNCMLKNQLRRESTLPFLWDIDNSLTPDTLFSLLDSQKVLIRYDEEEQQTRVYLRGSLLKLDKFPEQLVRCLFENTDVFNGRSILRALPEFNWEQVRALFISMYRSGVIVNVRDDTPSGVATEESS